MHASGVHATVAGVLLGLVVPVKPRASVPAVSNLDRETDVAHRFEHRMRPISAGIAVPVFAFFASGVTVVGGGFAAAARDAVAVGVVAGLVVGKFVGVFGDHLARRPLHAGPARRRPRLARRRRPVDAHRRGLHGVAARRRARLRGRVTDATTTSSSPSSPGRSWPPLLAAVALRLRNQVYRRIAELESRDDDADGIPDVFERDATGA